MPNPIRVLVVEDSGIMSELLIALLESDPTIRTVGVARNGQEAIEMVPRLHPDLVTMDVWMPVLDGFATVEHIMAYNPTPILVVTSSTTKRDVDVSLRMLTAGALDVMEKPSGLDQQSWQEKRQQLVDKVKLLARVRVVTHLKGRHTANLASLPATLPSITQPKKNNIPPNPVDAPRKPGVTDPARQPAKGNASSLPLHLQYPASGIVPPPTYAPLGPGELTPLPIPRQSQPVIEPNTTETIRMRWQDVQPIVLPNLTSAKTMFEAITIASSTGGPQALMHLLKRMPVNIPVPIFIVQHIAAGFTQGLVDWLASECAIKIRMAAAGEKVHHGTVYFAPDGKHMTIERDNTIHLAPDAKQGIICPSADVLMHSIAQVYGQRAIGVILTGMGRDGAQGMKAMHDAGAYCIAQDEASSVIFGMPKVAIGLGAVDEILPVEAITDRVIHVLTERVR